MAFRLPSISVSSERELQFGPASCVTRPWVVAAQISQLSQSIGWVSGASMMPRRAMIGSIGVFDKNYFLRFEEADFCCRKVGFAI